MYTGHARAGINRKQILYSTTLMPVGGLADCLLSNSICNSLSILYAPLIVETDLNFVFSSGKVSHAGRLMTQKAML